MFNIRGNHDRLVRDPYESLLGDIEPAPRLARRRIAKPRSQPRPRAAG